MLEYDQKNSITISNSQLEKPTNLINKKKYIATATLNANNICESRRAQFRVESKSRKIL